MIEKQKLLEIYNLFDRLHDSVIAAGTAIAATGDSDRLITAINEADTLADQMERLFAAILTDEERGDDGT